jgi:prepilin-type N-terminal cleavage/methylation domain-containing protein
MFPQKMQILQQQYRPGHRRAGGNAGSISGFTLVEILVVVIILGIASAIIIPQIGSRDDLIVSAAARVAMADLIYAQNRAIATQKPHFIKFDGQTYTIYDVPPVGAVTPIEHPINKKSYVTTFGAANSGLERVTIDSKDFDGQSIIGFDELGSPFAFDGTSTPPLVNEGTIVVKCGQTQLTIAIEPYTGEATVN